MSGRGPQHVVRRVDTARRSKSAQVHGGKSPTVYYDDQTDNYLLQGWKVLDPGCLAQMDVPDHETVIEFPKRMMQFFPEVNGSGGTDA